MKIILEHPTSPSCVRQRAATCQTPLPAPWKHHQLQHKQMTQAITTFSYILETEVPPDHYTEKGTTQRGRGPTITPAAHQCLRIPPLDHSPLPPKGSRWGALDRGGCCRKLLPGLADTMLRRNQGHETPVTELPSICWATVEAPLSHPLKPATCPGPAPPGQQDPGHLQPS